MMLCKVSASTASTASLVLMLTTLCAASSNSSATTHAKAVDIPNEYTYKLPDGFLSNENYTFVNGTSTPHDNHINDLFKKAADAPIISFDLSFSKLVGNAEIKLVAERPHDKWAYEGGIWVPERDEIWTISSIVQSSAGKPSTVYTYNLTSGAVNKLNASLPIINPNGGYYYNGKVYIGTYPSNSTYRGGVVSVDAHTLKVETVVNSYFGIEFNGIDDITWANRGRKDYMYFTDLYITPLAYPGTQHRAQLPSGVWRWDAQDEVLLPVIGRGDVNPNGIRVSPDHKSLYVTDSDPMFFSIPGPAPPAGGAVASWLAPYILKYDIDDEGHPVNKRIFGYVRRLIGDGIHCDDAGRVWTGEGEGIVVRSPSGKVLGIFNHSYFLKGENGAIDAIANFALAGDKVVVFAHERMYTVRLAQEVVSKNSTIVN